MNLKRIVLVFSVYLVGICLPIYAFAGCKVHLLTLQMSSEIREKIRKDHQDWIQSVSHNPVKLEHVLPSYTAIAKLGWGAESQGVYLIRSSEGKLEVLKIFNHEIDVGENAYALRENKNEGINTIDVLEINVERKFLRLQYVSGFDFGKILFDRSLNLTLKERWDLKKQFFDLKKLKAGLPKHVNPSNVIVDINTGQLFIIDPY